MSLGEIDLELSEIQYQFDRNTILLRQTQEDMKLAVDRIVTTGTSMIEEEKTCICEKSGNCTTDL